MSDIALVAKMAHAAIQRAKYAELRTMTPGPHGLDGKNGKDGKDGADGKDGIDGKAGKDGIDGKAGKDGAPGKAGKDGAPGRDGKQGEKGDKPDHEWIGTGLRFEKPDGTWGETVELQGPRGLRGGGGGGGGGSALPFDFDSLPMGTDEVPTEFAVKQSGQFVRVTYAQMQQWFTPGTETTTVNGAAITVGGQIVTITK